MNDGHRVALACDAADALGSRRWPESIISPKIAIPVDRHGTAEGSDWTWTWTWS